MNDALFTDVLPPIEVAAIEVSTKPYSVNISWKTGLIRFDRETYWVQYDTNTTLLQYTSMIVLGNEDTSTTNEYFSTNITELTPFTTYYFVLWASNSVGNTSTVMINFTTNQTGTLDEITNTIVTNVSLLFYLYTAPDVAPSNFQAFNITSTNITFQWDALIDQINGILQYYAITCDSERNTTTTVSINLYSFA